MSDDLVRLARQKTFGMRTQHYEGCENDHAECLMVRLANEVERLKAEVKRLKSERDEAVQDEKRLRVLIDHARQDEARWVWWGSWLSRAEEGGRDE